MKGRLPDVNNQAVSKHPNYDQGKKAEQEDSNKNKAIVKQLKPRGIGKEESKIWNRVALELAKNGRLKSLYVDIVEQYCIVKARLDLFRETLDKDDWTYVTEGRHGNQIKARPQVAQLNDDFRKFMQLTAHLGLSPATELRFSGNQGDLFANEFDDL